MMRSLIFKTLLVLVTILFVTILSFSYMALNRDRATLEASPLLGQAAPQFSINWLKGPQVLRDLIGPKIDLDDIRGSTTIINFWASWCTSCEEEAKELESLWVEKGAQGLKVIGIAVHDEEEDALAAAVRFGKTYPVGLDNQGQVSIDYGVTAVPETFIINKYGIVVQRFVGPVTRLDLLSFIDTLDN